MAKKNVLVIIPARGGSKRVPHKNIKLFCGRPLISLAIDQALKLSFVDRIIVDTDSSAIAALAKKYGAEVPFLRPARLAQDSSRVIDSILHLLSRLQKEENYSPSYVLLLQATSPLRELKDITKCWQFMKSSQATTVVTVCATRPKPKDLVWVKDVSTAMPANLSVGPEKAALHGYNGFVYIIETKALLSEKKIITKKTETVVCPEWRSVDIDVPEEWALAEILFKNQAKLIERMQAVAKK